MIANRMIPGSGVSRFGTRLQMTRHVGFAPWIVPTLLMVALPSISTAQSGTQPANQRSTTTEAVPARSSSTGVVVVELFTSQGCSSCPPADAALRQVDAVAKRSQLPVYALSFHVDYWNRLGWTDPYSDASFSKRQSAYASASGSNRVYTPQMIVNGTTEFVGSDKTKAHEAITNALRHKAVSQVSLQLEQNPLAAQLSVRFNVSGAAAGNVLNVAVVQTPAVNEVTRGENAGRKLAHVNVVRAFKTVALDPTTGSVRLQLPRGVDPSKSTVVAYVQDPNTRRISGATSVSAGL